MPDRGKRARHFFRSDHNAGNCAAGDVTRGEQNAGTLVWRSSTKKKTDSKTGENHFAAARCAVACVWSATASIPSRRLPSELRHKPHLRDISKHGAQRQFHARRNGIIIRMPSNPPRTATRTTRVISRSNPRIMIAGIVTPRPDAIGSPADPAV